MDDILVGKIWMCGVMGIMIFYGLAFWVLTVLGKKNREEYEKEINDL